ncbi:dihydrolipoamide acetyltransferase family protein [Microbulbifer sp. 2201CG32-9]|uniref:dihydrolipoamide acetyltransferase family protein n=1 Tax=Microbulbifer sp. 2201CG32-9 TaxID=3232309 RepID=UPI00345C09B4
MKIFTLPDLGEGLPDAVIREWHVDQGDQIAAHQTLVSVETAKALVEVPSPWGGIVEKLFAAAGETVDVGRPLVGFAQAAQQTPVEDSDSGTVVGRIQQSRELLGAEPVPIRATRHRATPAVRALARRLGVSLDALNPSAARLTAAEVRAAAPQGASAADSATAPTAGGSAANTSPARRAMALAMSRSRDQVAQMTLCDEVDISGWWRRENATLQLIRAIQAAVEAEPSLNATYEAGELLVKDALNIGLAVDAPKGLYVPVLRDVAAQSDEALLEGIENYKAQAQSGSIRQEDLRDASLLLSNFGSLAGRFATPVVMPPTVAIVAAGRAYQSVMAVGEQAAVRPVLPLSVSADHRAITGGELARFLKALVDALGPGTEQGSPGRKSSG